MCCLSCWFVVHSLCVYITWYSVWSKSYHYMSQNPVWNVQCPTWHACAARFPAFPRLSEGSSVDYQGPDKILHSEQIFGECGLFHRSPFLSCNIMYPYPLNSVKMKGFLISGTYTSKPFLSTLWKVGLYRAGIVVLMNLMFTFTVDWYCLFPVAVAHYCSQ